MSEGSSLEVFRGGGIFRCFLRPDCARGFETIAVGLNRELRGKGEDERIGCFRAWGDDSRVEFLRRRDLGSGSGSGGSSSEVVVPSVGAFRFLELLWCCELRRG